jgi:hypothetical protein
VFAVSVYAGKRFLMQQTCKAVPLRHLFHHFHRQLVVIGSDVCGAEHRGQFVLGR